MNLEERPEPYPIGKCIIYKLKDRDEFAGYFEGTLTENFTICSQGALIVFPNGCYFEGLSEKEGVYLNETTGLRYQGGWADETPSGFGKEKSNKGSYEGNYEKGCKHGKGKFTWADGSFYEGEFVKGVFEGHGVLVNQKERYSYAGEFKSGTRNGHGKEKHRNEEYEGKTHLT